MVGLIQILEKMNLEQMKRIWIKKIDEKMEKVKMRRWEKEVNMVK